MFSFNRNLWNLATSLFPFELITPTYQSFLWISKNFFCYASCNGVLQIITSNMFYFDLRKYSERLSKFWIDNVVLTCAINMFLSCFNTTFQRIWKRFCVYSVTQTIAKLKNNKIKNNNLQLAGTSKALLCFC